MSPLLISLFIPFFAGLMTTIGYLPTYISKKHQEKVLAYSLSFSAGIMITVSIFSLLPEAKELLRYYQESTWNLYFFFLLGIIFSRRMDHFLENQEKNAKLYQLGIFSVFTLILHNIPEGIIIAIPLFYATNNRKKAFFYTFIAGFSELLGAIIACIFLKEYFSLSLLGILLSITSGIMINISIRELLPNAFHYGKLKECGTGILLGSIIMLFCIFIFKI